MNKLIYLLPLVLLILLVSSFFFVIPPNYNKVFEEAYAERQDLVKKFIINPKTIRSREISEKGNPTRALGCLSGSSDYTINFTAQTGQGEKDFEFMTSWGSDETDEDVVHIIIPNLTKSKIDKGLFVVDEAATKQLVSEIVKETRLRKQLLEENLTEKEYTNEPDHLKKISTGIWTFKPEAFPKLQKALEIRQTELLGYHEGPTVLFTPSFWIPRIFYRC